VLTKYSNRSFNPL